MTHTISRKVMADKNTGKKMIAHDGCGLSEGFDFGDISDTDYTDTFADMDQAEQDRFDFTAGLRKALLVSVRTSAGKNGWVRGSDPVLDPLFAGAVSGSSEDGWTVRLSDAPGVTPTTMFDFVDLSDPADGGKTVDVALDLKAAPAAWSKKSAGWRLETGRGVSRYDLYILPTGKGTGKRSGSLIGSPVFVRGNVLAGMYGSLADILGFSNPSVCASLAGAPKEVTGRFECVMDPDAEYGRGFLDGAPERVGGDVTVTFPNAGKMRRPVRSFLWDGKGNIVPAFTDGIARRYYRITVGVPHPGANVAGRRKSEVSTLYLGASSGSPRDVPRLHTALFPGLDAAARVTVYGDPCAILDWLCVMNGLL